MVDLFFVVACLLKGIKSLPFWLSHLENISVLQKGISVFVDESSYIQRTVQ